MGYQLLQGVQVTPKGNYNLSRFGKSMINGEWPTSYAFGGWIYNANCDIGFSNQPSEIKLSIVLEVINKSQKYAFFDIQDADLKCDAGDGHDENLYDINFNGVTFTDMVLYQYEISLEANVKTLNVVFKDYSIILDKIYIGLLKRQGNTFVHSANATLTFPIVCPDCFLAGDSLNFQGSAQRTLAYGSYVGINNKVYDNFEKLRDTGNIFDNWAELFNAKTSSIKFDLNGGYLILGTEEATEQRCGDLAPIAYNFNQLLASLRLRGFVFAGAFPFATTDADYIYKQNYAGSLREVIQQWCSDLGLDFYCQGKSFIGININRALDISSVVQIADPTTALGMSFALSEDAAIVSYKSSSSLANTFKQAVITTNNRPRNEKTDSKAPKRYVGFTPLHPIDFNRHNNNFTFRTDAFGNQFLDIAWANDFSLSSNDRIKTLPELDGRNYGDIDAAIALSHYDDTLRDIYCAQRALYGQTMEIQAANFRALGMVPLVELLDEDKAMVLEKLLPSAGGGDEVSNICIDKRFYRVFVGYYYQKFKEDIVAWEQEAGNSMYKYGIVTKGLLGHYPYMPANSLTDLSPTQGFYGQYGNSLLRIQHNVEPAAQEYYSLRQAPFKDLVLYSGQLTPSNYALPLAPNTSGLLPIFPTGLFYGELTNDWGTTQEIFKRTLMLNLSDPCEEQFSSYPSYTNIVNNVSKKYQDWRLDFFRPIANPDIESLYLSVNSALDNLQNQSVLDRTVEDYYDFHYHLQKQCAKLHILILPDTINHPNINVSFTPQNSNFINPVVLQGYLDKEREAIKRRIQTETLSICDITLLQEMCRNSLYSQWQAGPPSGDSQFGCVIDEDKYNFLEDGFTYTQLTTPNSRALNVRITKNPIRNNNSDALLQTFKDADIDGNFYYSDLLTDQLGYTSAQANINLIYPVSFGSSAAYRGVLTSEVNLENRTPEIVEIYGQPVNAQNNKAASLKIINNVVDPDIQPQLDPYAERFVPYMTVITGNSQIITTIEQYHNFLVNLNNYELTSPMKTVELTLAGTPNDFGNFTQYIDPIYGLNKLSMIVSDNGVFTSLSYADRPKHLPRQESILNKIIMRIK